LEKQSQSLAQQMQEFKDMPSEEMQKIADELSKQNLPSEAQNALDQMKQSNSKGAQKSGQNISSQMQKLSEQLASLQQNMNQMLQQQMTMDITRTVQELMYIADEMENLRERIENERDNQKIMSLARKQEELRMVLNQSLQRVGEMAGKSFLLPPAVSSALSKADKEMSSAAQKLSQGQGINATQNQSEALGGINSAAEILLRSMSSMCQSSSASGMEQLMQQLQSMCNKQGMVNQQTLPMLGACNNPGGMTPDQTAAAQRLASEQAALRKTLEEMRSEFEQHSNLLGRMEETIQDMKQVEGDLNQMNVNERTLQRQDKILSRMLDAQKSLHKREFTEKRRSRSGEDVMRKSPGQLPEDLGERRDILQQSLLQILSTPYPRQYQEQVRKYFRALEREELNTQ